jgi:hypothetical protein
MEEETEQGMYNDQLALIPENLEGLSIIYKFKSKFVISPTLFYTGELQKEKNLPIGRGFLYD